MYLSRIVLNARSHVARGWLADCHALHRMIMSGFPSLQGDSARAALGVLYRVEAMNEPPSIPLLVQSKFEPNWRFETDAVAAIDRAKPLDQLLERIEARQRYRFRLRASPSRRVHRRAALEPDAESGRLRAERAEAIGKRVELLREEDQVAWLQRRAEAAGFSLVATHLAPNLDVLELQLSSDVKLTGRRLDQRLSLGTVLFEGVLEVANADLFRDAVVNGIGPGKAFGCGLLSLSHLLRSDV